MSRPPYLVFGANGVQTAAGPSRAHIPTLNCFFLEADAAAIDRYCSTVLTGISDGTVTYEAISSHIMVTFCSMVGGHSLTKPYTTMGLLDEQQFGVWLFVARTHHFGPVRVLDRILTAVPYMLVDNPLSLTIGREVNGFPKSWGYFDQHADQRFTVDTFGGNFTDGETAGRRHLCTVEATGPTQHAIQEFSDLAHLFEWVHPKLSFGLPGLGIAEEMAAGLAEGRVWSLFLRQFRSTENNLLACHQEVLEAPITASKVSARILPHEYDFRLDHLDSAPIDTELGVTSQTVPFGVQLTMDLELGLGETRWTSSETAGPSTTSALSS